MTVKDLINKLSKMPQDAVVVIDMCSECNELDGGEPTLEKMVRHGPQGQYMRYVKRYWPNDKPKPELVEVCHFPGN